MAQQSQVPSPIDKRNMLWSPDPRRPFDALALGDAFSETGRLSEALDFYERVNDSATRSERIGRLKSDALKSGNAFLIARIANRGLVPVAKDDWSQTARSARSSGQLRYALRAAIQAGDDALATELRAQLGDAVPQALAAQVAESPEQAHAGATHPGQKVEAVLAAGAAHEHEPSKAAEPRPSEPPRLAEPQNGNPPGASPAV